MTKDEVIKLLVLIESAYPHYIFKDETILQYLRFCDYMDCKKVTENVKKHIRKSPFPPAISEVSVFSNEENQLQETLQDGIKNGVVTMDCQFNHSRPNWIFEYALRKSV